MSCPCPCPCPNPAPYRGPAPCPCPHPCPRPCPYPAPAPLPCPCPVPTLCPCTRPCMPLRTKTCVAAEGMVAEDVAVGRPRRTGEDGPRGQPAVYPAAPASWACHRHCPRVKISTRNRGTVLAFRGQRARVSACRPQGTACSLPQSLSAQMVPAQALGGDLCAQRVRVLISAAQDRDSQVNPDGHRVQQDCPGPLRAPVPTCLGRDRVAVSDFICPQTRVPGDDDSWAHVWRTCY